MKVRFLQDYQGQYTGPHFYVAGQVVDLDESTASRLIADNRAVAVKREVERDYSKLTVVMLRDLLSRRGLSTHGNKAALVERLK